MTLVPLMALASIGPAFVVELVRLSQKKKTRKVAGSPTCGQLDLSSSGHEEQSRNSYNIEEKHNE